VLRGLIAAVRSNELLEGQYRHDQNARDGRGAKIHVCVDSKRRLLNFVITGGQMHDSQASGKLLDRLPPSPAVTSDKIYDSKTARQPNRNDCVAANNVVAAL